MTDYKAEAEQLDCSHWRDVGVDGPVCRSCIAAALEAAEKRGRIAGLREAATMMDNEGESLGSFYMRILNRAEEVERE